MRLFFEAPRTFDLKMYFRRGLGLDPDTQTIRIDPARYGPNRSNAVGKRADAKEVLGETLISGRMGGPARSAHDVLFLLFLFYWSCQAEDVGNRYEIGAFAW